MQPDNPLINWTWKSDKICLKFTFIGMLEIEDAISAVEKWKKAFSSRPSDKIVLIWECHHMTGYDTESRLLWQKTLKELKPQIDSIWLITTSRLIRMGAQIMTLFTSINTEIVETEDQIVF